MIRLATGADAAGILNIYAPYIRDTSLTFEMELPSEAAFATRIESYLRQWPWLVWESEGRIAGYAYGSRYRERAGYQWCVECSVYIHDDFRGKGIAKALYAALFRLLKMQGYYTVYAVINLPNEPSVRLHEACGFQSFARYENVGYKLGQWKTVGWWQLSLRPYDEAPQAPRAFPELTPEELQSALEASSP